MTSPSHGPFLAQPILGRKPGECENRFGFPFRNAVSLLSGNDTKDFG